jgi:hypothetical protein
MPEGRWRRALGPVLSALVAGLLVASASFGAISAAEQVPAASPSVPGCARPSRSGSAAWYEMIERSDSRGRLTGYALRLGSLSAEATARSIALPPESHAAGPFGGVVLYGSDDGRRSELRLVVAETGCEAVVMASAQVIRRSTVDPAGRFVYYHLVDRATRSDLGIWRSTLADGSAAAQVVAPLAKADLSVGPNAIGTTFSTEFAWTSDGLDLAVQSCGATRCTTRVLHTANGQLAAHATAGQGQMLGMTDDLLVTYGACLGFPCPIVGTERATGRVRALVGAAGGAVLVNGGAGGRLLYEPPLATGYELAALDLGSSASRTVYRADVHGQRLLPQASRSLASASVPDGWAVLVAPDGRAAFETSALLLRADDGAQAALKGASR